MLENNGLSADDINTMHKIADKLYDGVPATGIPILMIKDTYDDWRGIFKWLIKNDITGQKLVEFFQNESPDGGGVHMGVTHILSRIKGNKHHTVGIMADELSKK